MISIPNEVKNYLFFVFECYIVNKGVTIIGPNIQIKEWFLTAEIS